MATGAGFGGLISALLPLVGLVSIIRARRQRRAGLPATTDDGERRQIAAAEMERRMASYLAGRDAGPADATPATDRRTGDERG